MPLSTAFRTNALQVAPTHWTRLERNEIEFVRFGVGHTDGVVIPLRFDTPPEPGSRGHFAGVTGSELKNAVLAARIPFRIDLETWRLPYLLHAADYSFGSDARTIVGRAVRLPLKPHAFADGAAVDALAQAAVIAQVGADVTFAPDFLVRSLDDPWLAVNLRMIEATRALSPGHSMGVAIHATLRDVVSGLLPALAARYADVVPPGTVCVLTVSDLRENLDISTLASYFEGIAALDAYGFQVIADRAGFASVASVATFATGCVLGTTKYQTAPPSPIFEGEHHPKVLVKYRVARQGRSVNRDKAMGQLRRGTLPPCRHPHCAARQYETTGELLPLRLHSAHDVRLELGAVRAMGAPQMVRIWRRRDQPARLSRIAQAIELAEVRRMAA
jgi:hypothetical protein